MYKKLFELSTFTKPADSRSDYEAPSPSGKTSSQIAAPFAAASNRIPADTEIDETVASAPQTRLKIGARSCLDAAGLAVSGGAGIFNSQPSPGGLYIQGITWYIEPRDDDWLYS